jgi:twitching motility two-component system response regulator PilH
MDLLRQIKSILNDGPQPVQKEYLQISEIDRRRRKRPSHRGRKILVVDDSATVVATFDKVLRSAGCLVQDAVDAEKGLEIARGEQPDLIFLDIVLPGMNGFAALRQIRRDPRTHHIPVIIISGNEQAIEQFYAKRIGADDFMRKPFSRGELFTHVEMLIVRGKLRRIEAVTAPRNPRSRIVNPVTVLGISGPGPSHALASPSIEKVTAENSSNTSIVDITAIEARRQLTSMGLQYASQEQFSAAMKRRDKLTVRLFVIGRGVKI